MSIKVNKICVYKNGAWHPITKVYKDGWKKFRGLFYDGNWYKLEKPYLIINSTEFEEEEEDGVTKVKIDHIRHSFSVEIDVRDNDHYWTAYTGEGEDWITFGSDSELTASGHGSDDLLVTVGENQTGTFRIGSVTIGLPNHDNVGDESFVIEQEG